MRDDALDALALEVGTRLQENRATLATAESCTGGLVAAAVTEIAGSSAWFERGYVTYSNAAKVEMLGVADALIAAHGAVSEEVARAMAEGARRVASATYALAITGIAGPGGGTAQKPVGTVCFAWASATQVTAATQRFAGDRRAVREQSTLHALQGLLAFIATAARPDAGRR